MSNTLATTTDLLRVASELSSLDTDTLQDFLDDAADLINQAWLGNALSEAHARLAAHMAVLAHPALMPLVKEGDLTYFVPTQDSGGYEQTRHGREYQRIVRGLGPASVAL